MEDVEELFKALNPQETLMRTITKSKIEVSKIKLPKLDHLKKHCTYNEKKNISEAHSIIQKYQTLRRNLQRIWLYTRNKEVLLPMIFMKHLIPFDTLVNKIDSETAINGETRQVMCSLSQEIDKLLATYQELHTKPKDDLDQFLQALMNPEEREEP